jgi:hypothetical protein
MLLLAKLCLCLQSALRPHLSITNVCAYLIVPSAQHPLKSSHHDAQMLGLIIVYSHSFRLRTKATEFSLILATVFDIAFSPDSLSHGHQFPGVSASSSCSDICNYMPQADFETSIPVFALRLRVLSSEAVSIKGCSFLYQSIPLTFTSNLVVK